MSPETEGYEGIKDWFTYLHKCLLTLNWTGKQRGSPVDRSPHLRGKAGEKVGQDSGMTILLLFFPQITYFFHI